MSGVSGWLLQRISGGVLFLGLALHFYTMHFSGKGNIGYEVVMERFSDPAWIAFNAVFLVSVIYHGFAGLWVMALEYISPGRWLKASQVLLAGAAILLAIAGLYLLTLRQGQ